MGVPPLHIAPDYLSSFNADLFTASYPAGGASAADKIDGNGINHVPPFSYTVLQWSWQQLEGPNGQRLLWFMKETRPFSYTGAHVAYYVDDLTPDGTESQPGRYGNYGVSWEGESQLMQDTQCNQLNPDDSSKLWRELEMYVFAPRAGTNADTYLDWLERPLVTFTAPIDNGVTPPIPQPPCPVNLVPSVGSNGDAVDLTPTSPQCPIAGISIFRGIGTGRLTYLAHVAPGQPYHDASVVPGVTFRYQAFAHNTAGQFAAGSQPFSVLVQDTSPPNPPTGLTAVPLSGGALINWNSSTSWDVVGYDIYATVSHGGPYEKVTVQPTLGSATQFAATGLQPDTTYYLVLQAVDRANNHSAFTDEVAVTTLP